MADAVNFACLHNLEGSALVLGASFWMMTEEIVKVWFATTTKLRVTYYIITYLLAVSNICN